MAPKKEAAVKNDGPSEKALATRAEIANRPRQSVVRLVEYFGIIKAGAPDRLDEFWSAEEQAELNAVVGSVSDKLTEAAERARQEQIDRAVHALENTDEKNGYANFAFNAEAFADKTREKKARVKRSPLEKATELLELTPEEQAVLDQLLAARGQASAAA